ncbi:50S ribosomal protein L10 [candidate division CPR3 bacterium 4484_211]|uniref:Large ribosomal subunit protein uL10 n=1 Tax=candidate division CPR3 bacterium 4484_211 TaxID=1968527 RepID=A0A1W9NXJ6_UNCC3|nr:MAG: 50S ribosomal protein L10 [candidate division CPR3 bacterium 4484_211]
MPTKKKKEIVKTTEEKLKQAQVVVFTDFTGLSTTDFEELRRKLEEKEAAFTVVKNTLLNLACVRANYGTLNPSVARGPTAVLFYPKEDVEAVKIIYEFSKRNENLKIKGGFLEKKPLSSQEITTLARLPARKELLARIARETKAPAANLVTVLQMNTRNLVNVLRLIRPDRN